MWFLLLLIPLVYGISPECKSYLKGVALTNANFQVCALVGARPFSVCTKCYNNYAAAFNTFVMLKDGRGPVEKNCSEDLVSGDRVSIINRDFNHLTTTWNAANCDSCLLAAHNKDVVSFTVADTTLEFQRRAQEVSTCIDFQLQNRSLICDVCSNHFRSLSEYYDALNEKFKGTMCMDILDTMNQTRVEWSKFGCAKVYAIDYKVWILTNIIGALTVGFYLFARFSQNPKDSAIIEGRTLRDRMSRIFQNDGRNTSVNSDSQEFPRPKTELRQ